MLVMQAAIKRTNEYPTDISFMIIYVMLLSLDNNCETVLEYDLICLM